MSGIFMCLSRERRKGIKEKGEAISDSVDARDLRQPGLAALKLGGIHHCITRARAQPATEAPATEAPGRLGESTSTKLTGIGRPTK